MTNAATAHVSVETGGHVCLIRLNRPEARNALNPAILAELARRFESGDADPDIRCFVLTGGAEVFSAGADIDALDGHTPASYLDSVNRRAFDTIRATRKPIVVGVAGYCLGGGCEIALSCDIVVAGDDAVFGQPEVNLGIIPGAGGTQFWSERAGTGVQAEAALQGRMIDAYEARRIGLVDEIVPSNKIVEAAVARARDVALKAPLAVRAAKAAMRARWQAPLAISLEIEVGLMASLLASQDAKEGVSAFVEKRKPQFSGR